MPLYEYKCENCGEQFEKMVSFSQSDKMPVCPICGSEQTRKKLSMIASGGGSADSCGSSGSFT